VKERVGSRVVIATVCIPAPRLQADIVAFAKTLTLPFLTLSYSTLPYTPPYRSYPALTMALPNTHLLSIPRELCDEIYGYLGHEATIDWKWDNLRKR
jgi:hypothetical protein